MLRVWDSGFRVWEGFRMLRFWDLGGFRVWEGLRFREVEGLGFRV